VGDHARRTGARLWRGPRLRHIGAIEELHARGHEIVRSRERRWARSSAGSRPRASSTNSATGPPTSPSGTSSVSRPRHLPARRHQGRACGGQGERDLGGVRIEDLPIPFTALRQRTSPTGASVVAARPVDAAIVRPSRSRASSRRDAVTAGSSRTEACSTRCPWNHHGDPVGLPRSPSPCPASPRPRNRAPREETSQHAGGVDWAERFRRSAADALDGNLVGPSSRASSPRPTTPSRRRPATSPFEALPDDLRTADVIIALPDTMQGLIEGSGSRSTRRHPRDRAVATCPRSTSTARIRSSRSVGALTADALDRAGH
jgi:hypothetical protein